MTKEPHACPPRNMNCASTPPRYASVPAATIRSRFNGHAPATVRHSELQVVYRWSRLKEEERHRFERLTSEYSLSLTTPGRHLPAALLFGSPTPSWDDHLYGDGNRKEGNRIVRKSERRVERQMRLLRIPCPGPSTSTHAPQSLNSAFSSMIVIAPMVIARGCGGGREVPCVEDGIACGHDKREPRFILITPPRNAYPSSQCASRHPSPPTPASAATTIAFDLAFLLLNTFTTRTCTFFSLPYVLPAMMPTRCAPCPLSSTGVSPS